MNMRLLGARTLKEVVPEMVDASSLQSHIVAVPGDRLYDSNCACSLPWFPRAGTDASAAVDESMQHARLREVKSKM